MKHLLHVYYNHQIFQLDEDDLKYCDVEEPSAISYYLSLIGESLASHPTNIAALMKMPSFTAIVFGQRDSKFDLNLEQSVLLKQISDVRETRPELVKREEGLTFCVVLEAYRAPHHWFFFLSPIWMLCSEQTSGPLAEYATRSRRLLIQNTCSVDAFLLGGAAALRIMEERTISDDWLQKWIHDGGVPAFVLASVRHPPICIPRALTRSYADHVRQTRLLASTHGQDHHNTVVRLLSLARERRSDRRNGLISLRLGGRIAKARRGKGTGKSYYSSIASHVI
jgi:hypothetical protein